MASPSAASLRGACTCGRNNYAIVLPSAATARQELEIFFDDRTENAYLRVPISRYQSFTTAFYPDETHSSIRRTFTPHHAPNSQLIFCGLCGTHLSHWTESPPTESQYLSISLPTMSGRDLERLEDLGVLRPEVDDAVDAALLPSAPPSDPTAAEATEDAEQRSTSKTFSPTALAAATPASASSASTITRGTSAGGLDWIQAARSSGGLKTRRGVGRSSDGRQVVEWEVSEYDEGVEEGMAGMAGTMLGRGKRKLGEGAPGEMEE